MKSSHSHPCPRCTGQEACSSPCSIRADISGADGFFGDPRRCSLCRKAGRSFSAPEVAAAAGLSSAEVLAAYKRGDLDLQSLSSVARFIEQRKADTPGHSDSAARAAVRELRFAGCCAQDLGFGCFLWAPIYKEGENWPPHSPSPGSMRFDPSRHTAADVEKALANRLPCYAFAGELAGPLLAAAATNPRRSFLPLPPFSSLLGQLAERCERGQGYDQEAVRLRRVLGESIGFDDPVLCRLQVRAARRKS